MQISNIRAWLRALILATLLPMATVGAVGAYTLLHRKRAPVAGAEKRRP